MGIFQSFVAPLAAKAVSSLLNRREPTQPSQTFTIGEGLSRTEALRAKQTVQERTAMGVADTQNKIERVAQAVKNIGNTQIPVPTGALKEVAKQAIVSTLPTPFQSIARKVLPVNVENFKQVTPMNVAEIATAPARETAGSLVRTGARIGLQEYKAQTGESITLVPRTMTEKLLLGKEEIRPFSEGPIASRVASPFRALAKRAGASEKNAERFSALPITAAALFLDNPFIGGAGKAGKEVAEKAGKEVAENLVERKFITSVKNIIPEAGTRVAGQYVPRSTDELAMKAVNLIKDNINVAEKIAMKGNDDTAVAVASELIKKYGEEARAATDGAVANALYDKAAEIANNLAPKLTEQGRAIQAASILSRLTPEGQLRFAARQIQKYNEKAVTKIPELTGEQARTILDTAKKIEAMPDGLQKASEMQKLQDDIKALAPTPLLKKITAVWKAGLLTGIKTSGLNFFSNAAHAGSEIAKDVPATIVDKVTSLFTGERTKTLNVTGAGKGIKEGFEKGLHFFKTGFDERNIGAKIDYQKVNFGKGPVAKAFQIYTDTVFRVLGSADQPFYYGALSRSLGDQAMAQGLNKGLKGKALKEYAEKLLEAPSEEMIRYATADAAQAVFQNETYLGKAAKAIQNVPVVGEIVVPFGRTPAAVATQILNYTPAGPVAEIVKQIRNKKFDQRAFSQAMGRGITGTGVLFLGAELAKQGLVSLDRPATEKEQKLWELEGRKPNSIKIGNKWRSPTVLGPAGNLLLIGGHFEQAFKETGSPSEALSKAAFGSLKSFTEQTFLTGINSAVTALNDPERFAEGYIGSLVSSFVPTLVSDVARTKDPLERRVESIGERVKARIPGVRESLEPQVDVLGRERESVGNALEILLDPTRPSPVDNSPVVVELRRLTDAGQEVSPTLLGDKKGYEALTQKENTQIWKDAGTLLNTKLEKLFAHEEYQKLDDEDRGKVVSNFVTQAQLKTKADFVLKKIEGMDEEQTKAELSRLKKGGFLTKELYNYINEEI